MSDARLADPFRAAPDSMNALLALETASESIGLDPRLIELIRLRTSQINGCTACVHRHVTTAKQLGETAMRLHMLPAWRGSSLYTDRERAALTWTETLARVAETGAPDADYAVFAAAFSPPEQVRITMIIGATNIWNRVQVGFRAQHPVDLEQDVPQWLER